MTKNKMIKNMGGIDRIVRLIVGVVLLGLTLNGNIGSWGYIGAIPLLTAIFAWCPGYHLLHINTCARPKA